MNPDDTIAAVATPPGAGGIGIIRLSGPAAELIARRLFHPARNIEAFTSHRLYHGHIVAPATGSVLDEVLLCLMRTPHSYTGEDVVEIHCHGGGLVLQSVLQAVVDAGARPAEAGEFTKRAFLNNRMDLSQAEAILDTIAAKTEKGLQIALTHLRGDLADRTEGIRAELAWVMAYLEADIDFAEEDGVSVQPADLLERLQAVTAEVNRLLCTFTAGRIYREGVSAVIAGRVNVGKSSLLNRFLGEARAIVTPFPGTTRDWIEDFVDMGGIPVRLTDTAGIRATEDPIEQEGIRRVREKLAKADIILLVFDGSEPLTDADRQIMEEYKSRTLIPVVNKADLPRALDPAEIRERLPGREPLWVSAKFGDGLPALKEALRLLLVSPRAEAASDGVVITRMRHKMALEKTFFFLSEATAGLVCERPPELVACDVREALDCIGEISGRTTGEDILDKIFSTFCIGK